jgi:DNA-directed RNA polymerase sigma subunit (sigma70/sigma32)
LSAGEGIFALGDLIEDQNTILPIDAAIQSNLRDTTTRALTSLIPREERIVRMALASASTATTHWSKWANEFE